MYKRLHLGFTLVVLVVSPLGCTNRTETKDDAPPKKDNPVVKDTPKKDDPPAVKETPKVKPDPREVRIFVDGMSHEDNLKLI